MSIKNRPTLRDLDLHSARRITHHRYVRHGEETPVGWTDEGLCPGHHGRWARMAVMIEQSVKLLDLVKKRGNRP